MFWFDPRLLNPILSSKGALTKFNFMLELIIIIRVSWVLSHFFWVPRHEKQCLILGTLEPRLFQVRNPSRGQSGGWNGSGFDSKPPTKTFFSVKSGNQETQNILLEQLCLKNNEGESLLGIWIRGYHLHCKITLCTIQK